MRQSTGSADEIGSEPAGEGRSVRSTRMIEKVLLSELPVLVDEEPELADHVWRTLSMIQSHAAKRRSKLFDWS